MALRFDFSEHFCSFFCVGFESRFWPDRLGGGESVKSLCRDDIEPGRCSLKGAEGGDSTLVSGIVSILCLCGGSRSGSESDFPSQLSRSRTLISSEIETIGVKHFEEQVSVTEFCFGSDSRLREIHGFRRCTSLCRIEFPSSLEIISGFGFFEYLRGRNSSGSSPAAA
jgi:hypothetical protein